MSNELFNDLIGMELSNIGRASNLTWFAFGKEKKILDFYGKEKTISEYSLHVQCSWRLVFNGEIKITSMDIYVPSDEDTYNKYFDWNSEITRFDNLIKQWMSNKEKKRILDIKLTGLGDLKIKFSDNMVLEVFIDTTNEECWRLFNSFDENSKSIVHYGAFIEIQ